MRAYGSSPLYNYAELVFRSKRLFILSMILGLVASVVFYYSHQKVYNASMIVVLTGSEIVNPKDDKERGTVEYKISLLNVLLRDPNFIKGAMREGHLDAGMSDLDFADFCKDATAALSYASDKSNILEIKCSWKTKDVCERILKSLYSAYSRNVIEQETVGSTARTSMLNVLLKDYTDKYDSLNDKVKKYQEKHAGQSLEDFEHTNNEYITQQHVVATITDNLSAAQRQFAAIDAKFRTTPPTVQDTVTYNGSANSPERINATKEKDAAKEALDQLLLRYTPATPRVVEAQAKYDAIVAKITRIDEEAKKATLKPTRDNIATIKENINPAYQNLEAQRTEQQLNITRIQSELQNAQKQLEVLGKRLHIAPAERIAFQKMTADMGLYTKVHDDLRAELETARLNEMRDKEMKTKEMTVLVQPEAEAERGGARAVLTIAAGPILGLVIAFCFSLAGEAMDQTLRTPLEVEKYLDKPVLAVLPRLENRKSRRGQIEAAGQLPQQDPMPNSLES